MIEELRRRRLLSVLGYEAGTMGYRFAGALNDAFECLDQVMTKVVAGGEHLESHSCPTVVDKASLERLGFFDKLPCVPFEAIPHLGRPVDSDSSRWLLNPSVCYHTFTHLAGSPIEGRLTLMTVRGSSHRYEPERDDPSRLGCFTMREFVLVGSSEVVKARSAELFDRCVSFVERLAERATVGAATDVFYGAQAEAARRVQAALRAKEELRLPWADGQSIAVASKNLHRDVMTTAFGVSHVSGRPLQSACVAVGCERLLLALLAATPEHDPVSLLRRVSDVANEVLA